MKPKKTPRADLRNKRGLFFEIGLIASLLAAIIVFQQGRGELPKREIHTLEGPLIPQELIPVTVEPPKPAEPPRIEVRALIDVFELRPDHIRIDRPAMIGDDFSEIVFVPVSEPEQEVEEPVLDSFLVDRKPLFNGAGVEEFRAWVMRLLNYPAALQEMGIQGRVTVQFVIDTQGKMSGVEVLASPDRLLSEEAVRVLQASPDWEPGLNRGRPVRVRFIIPVDFQLL